MSDGEDACDAEEDAAHLARDGRATNDALNESSEINERSEDVESARPPSTVRISRHGPKRAAHRNTARRPLGRARPTQG